jgi:hypothetical protein
MQVEPIFILGILLIVIAAVWYVMGIVAKTVRMVVSAIMMILFIALSGYLYYDSNQLQTSFVTQPKLFAYADNGQILAAFETTTGEPSIKQDLSKERVAYSTDNLKELKGSAYKVLIFNKASFADVGNINLSSISLTREQAFLILSSSTPKNDYTAEYVLQKNISDAVINDDALGTNDNLKGLIFAALVGELSKNGDIVLMTRTGAVTIYPDSATLWLIRNIPDFAMPYFVKGGTA